MWHNYLRNTLILYNNTMYTQKEMLENLADFIKELEKSKMITLHTGTELEILANRFLTGQKL